jgi:hypothetical protein
LPLLFASFLLFLLVCASVKPSSRF